MEEEDRISRIFEGKTVFISGASGYLGKLFIEKLLRCTEVRKIYLLVREKKGRNPQDRLDDILGNVCFSVLKQMKPEAFKKCAVISGDVMEENLGISPENRKILQEEVEYVIHSAASTRFDDTIKYAVTINTRGTKFMLDLAKQCKNLKLFVHISTSYAFPKEKIVYEKFYEPPADPESVLQSISWIKEDENGIVTRELLGDSPNTYTFSKALAEELVRREVGKIPLIVVRPALVIPCLEEPIAGWVNNLQGPIGIFVGAGKGVIRTMYMDSKSYANMIPADSTINVIMITMWDYLTNGKQQVFNACVPESDIKMPWEDIIELGKDVIHKEVPFNQLLWYPDGVMTKSKIWHSFNFIVFQIIPAVIIDFLLMCLGYKKFLLAINIRLYKGQEMFEYYTNKAWDFDLSYFIKLRRTLNSVEKKKYKVDSDGVDLRKYLKNCMFYIRRHVFKEADELLPQAKRNLKIFFVVDRIIKILFFAMVINCLYKWILQPIFG